MTLIDDAKSKGIVVSSRNEFPDVKGTDTMYSVTFIVMPITQ